MAVVDGRASKDVCCLLNDGALSEKGVAWALLSSGARYQQSVLMPLALSVAYHPDAPEPGNAPQGEWLPTYLPSAAGSSNGLHGEHSMVLPGASRIPRGFTFGRHRIRCS